MAKGGTVKPILYKDLMQKIVDLTDEERGFTIVLDQRGEDGQLLFPNAVRYYAGCETDVALQNAGRRISAGRFYGVLESARKMALVHPGEDMRFIDPATARVWCAFYGTITGIAVTDVVVEDEQLPFGNPERKWVVLKTQIIA